MVDLGAEQQENRGSPEYVLLSAPAVHFFRILKPRLPVLAPQDDHYQLPAAYSVGRAQTGACSGRDSSFDSDALPYFIQMLVGVMPQNFPEWIDEYLLQPNLSLRTSHLWTFLRNICLRRWLLRHILVSLAISRGVEQLLEFVSPVGLSKRVLANPSVWAYLFISNTNRRIDSFSYSWSQQPLHSLNSSRLGVYLSIDCSLVYLKLKNFPKYWASAIPASFPEGSSNPYSKSTSRTSSPDLKLALVPSMQLALVWTGIHCSLTLTWYSLHSPNTVQAVMIFVKLAICRCSSEHCESKVSPLSAHIAMQLWADRTGFRSKMVEMGFISRSLKDERSGLESGTIFQGFWCFWMDCRWVKNDFLRVLAGGETQGLASGETPRVVELVWQQVDLAMGDCEQQRSSFYVSDSGLSSLSSLPRCSSSCSAVSICSRDSSSSLNIIIFINYQQLQLASCIYQTEYDRQFRREIIKRQSIDNQLSLIDTQLIDQFIIHLIIQFIIQLIIMESGGAQKQTQAQKVAVRTHHAIKTQREAERVLPVTARQQMAQQKQQIDLPHSQKGLTFALKRKPIQKPYHLLTLKKRIHKKTNQISFIVQESSAVKVAYEHQELCDFISSQGATLLPSSDAYTVDREELLTLVKEQLSARVQARADKQAVEVREDLWELIKPSSYLKQYNLEPPKCDFFVNKVKHEEERQLASCSIGFDDPLPQSLANIPESIRDSPLYEAVSTFVQKRPCWLKNVLLVTLKQQGLEGSFGLNQLKNVLKHLCYTFRNGPWKHTFCAFGFDPRKNPKAVIYQNVSVKLKKKEVEDYEEEAGYQTYDPTFSDSPSGFIRGYQLGDLAIQSVQELLRGKLISGGEECSKEHGWLSPSEHANVLRWMRQQRQSSR